MHQNLSRKYRPQTFEALVGHSPIVTTLKNAVRLQKVAPAYIFCGSRGTGKTTLARLFAKTLNCTQLLSSTEPCNTCSCCLEISQGKSLSVIEIDGASNRGIDDIRKLNETVGYSVLSGQYKVYIIDEVHMLTKEAFNALLKTLEEPPSNVKFLFATTEPQKVLPTIMSRCQRFDLKRLSSQEIVGKLERIAHDLSLTVEQEAFELIAHTAEGGLRDAESIFDQLLCFETGAISYQTIREFLGIPSRQLYFDLDEAIKSYELSSAFLLAQKLFSTGQEMHDFLEGLLSHFRLHLLNLLKLPSDTFLHPQEKAHYQTFASFYTQDHLLYIVNYLMGWIKELGKITLKRVTLEMIFLHLIQSHFRLSLPSLVRRLEELSHQESASLANTPDTIQTPLQQEEPPAPQAILEKRSPQEEPLQSLSEISSPAPSVEKYFTQEELAPLQEKPPSLPKESGAFSSQPILNTDKMEQGTLRDISSPAPSVEKHLTQEELSPPREKPSSLPKETADPFSQSILIREELLQDTLKDLSSQAPSVEKFLNQEPISPLTSFSQETFKQEPHSQESTLQVTLESSFVTQELSSFSSLPQGTLLEEAEALSIHTIVKTEEIVSEVREDIPVISPQKLPLEDAQERVAAPSETAPSSPVFHKSKYDTILRFAAVELEGILKKD
ncbi:DNA polymerase III subunit gamma/tau [Rhabdochlamydiaceae symbiont of Dictyostelium giganteum]|uniref:DNA polymerase III subunit gamma/tau n=1 Tax=Rhabdochlamydiaceae symbiont of Dictyostelium giganteum TaxID=3342349 RepID=UPI00384F13D9